MSESSSSEDSDANSLEDGAIGNIKNDLAKCFIKHQISTSAANEILEIVGRVVDDLPKDVRTLKNTPTTIDKVPLFEGEYFHYGLKDCLTDFLVSESHDSRIEINVNVDSISISLIYNSHISFLLYKINILKNIKWNFFYLLWSSIFI